MERGAARRRHERVPREGEPYARAAWTSVDATLGAWAAAWQDTYDDVCAATHVRHEQPQVVLDRAMACLREQRNELDALVALFERADGDVVEHAGAAARSLRMPEECRAPPRNPDELDLATRSRAQALIEELAQVRAWVEGHRLAAALDAAQRIAAEADALVLPALAAEASVLASRAAAGSGHAAPAIEYLDRAVLSAEAAGDDRTRADALAELVYVAGHLGNQVAQAHWYARTADEVLNHIGGPARLRIALRSNEAVLWSDEGDHERAIEGFRAALEMRDELGAGIDETLATICNNIGSAYFARGEHARAAGGPRRRTGCGSRSPAPITRASRMRWSTRATCCSRSGTPRTRWSTTSAR